MRLSPSVEMIVTELKRTGDGSLREAGTVFKFTSTEHSAPQDELELHLQVKTNRKEIPGSNEVVEHVMAATWQPFEVKGEWDDKWGNRIPGASSNQFRTGSFAFSTYQEFSEMVQRGSYVRLEVDALSFYGIITDLYITYRRQTLIGWRFMISPHANNTVSKGSSRVRFTSLKSIPKWIEDAQLTTDQLNSLFASAKKLAFKTPQLDFFSGSLLAVNDALNRLQRVGSDSLNVSAVQKLLLLATTFRRVGGASHQAALSLHRVTSSLTIAYDSVLESAKHAEWISSSITTLWTLVGQSRNAENDMRQRAGRQPRAVYYPKAGESLEKISTRFYGTAGAWRVIYDANNLSSLVLDGTEELVIPERRT